MSLVLIHRLVSSFLDLWRQLFLELLALSQRLLKSCFLLNAIFSFMKASWELRNFLTKAFAAILYALAFYA